MKMPSSRRGSFWVATGLSVLLAMEGIAWLGWWGLEGRPFAYRQGASGVAGAVAREAIGHLRDAAVEGDLPPQLFWLGNEVLHPFLGFVRDPAGQATPPFDRVDEWGFPAPRVAATPTRNRDQVTVAVTGGSVAALFVLMAGEELARLLEASQSFAGREVVVEGWANPGYKQPQQLFTLAWFLAHGRRPQVVINLDGFNDLVLGWAENFHQGVYPFYPRSWNWRVREVPDAAVQQAIGRVAWARERRSAAAAGHATSPLARSAMASVLWRARDRRWEAELAAAEVALREIGARGESGRDYLTQGPPPRQRELVAHLDEAAELWRRSSEQMAALCQGAGIAYFHFLQPNQYVPESKPMGRQERLQAVGYPWAERIVPRGYARLLEQGELLRAREVRFHALHLLFAGIEESLYVDRCCHFGEEGNRLLAQAVAAAILGETEGPVSSPAEGGAASSPRL
jgi:hypothetical protein